MLSLKTARRLIRKISSFVTSGLERSLIGSKQLVVISKGEAGEGKTDVEMRIAENVREK